jgi:hypothetical protein
VSEKKRDASPLSLATPTERSVLGVPDTDLTPLSVEFRVRESGVVLRRESRYEEVARYRDADGSVRESVQEAWPADDLLWIKDPQNPWPQLERIACEASELLGGFGLPFAGREFERDESGVRFFFWEDGDGRLCWGDAAPFGAERVRRGSFVPPSDADRIAQQEAGLAEFSHAYEIPYALQFLETWRELPDEKAAWRRRDGRPPSAPDAADIGFALGLQLGALLAEWRLVRKFGKVVFDRHKFNACRPDPKPAPRAFNHDDAVNRARAICARNKNLKTHSIARLVAADIGAKAGTVRNVLSARKEEWQ